ncbi:MAG: hypothetical protein KME52_25015 [Desmonostoc geniculatum HA4340-LM1]|jgi:hypothetical protein|nr:hypothetical protein [Desmonostoc geniculatum HA4340-LM1]
MTGQNEPIKISSLQERYKLNSRQAVNNRINGLGIEPVVRGKISCEQLEILDRLDIHIRSGGAIADFPILPEVQPSALDKQDLTMDIEPFDYAQDKPDQIAAINVMAQLIEKMMSYAYARNSSPLAGYEELEKAIANEWVLPTSKIKELIGATPKTSKNEESFVRGSFVFVKVGKIGLETGWKVSKKI